MKIRFHVPNLDIIIALLYISICLVRINTNLYIIAEIILLSLWLVISFLKGGAKKYSSSKSFFLFFGLVIYLFILCSLATNPYNGLVYSGVRFIYLGPALLCIYYFENDSRDQLYNASMLVWSLICIYALVFYYYNPHAARHLAITLDYYGHTVLGGGYALAYGAAILAVYFLGVILDKENRSLISHKKRINILVGLIINFLVVIKTASVITNIAMAIGLFYTVFIALFYRRRQYSQMVIAFLALTIIVLFILVNWSKIGYGIIAYTQGSNDIVNIRFNEIGQHMIGQGSTDSDFNYRIQIIKKTFALFFERPLLGWGFFTGYDYRTGIQIGIGTHGQFSDILALHGIVGGFLFFGLYHGFFKLVHNIDNNPLYKGYFYTFAFMFLFNPFESFGGHFILFMIIPFCAKQITEQRYVPEINNSI